MLQILCMVDSEDYWYLNSVIERSKSVNLYGYTFEVEGGTESTGSSVIRLIVVELMDAKMVVGLITPSDLKLEKELKLRFTSNDSPTKDIVVECKLSDEVKKASYMGDDLEKIEYIGYTLEKFYDSKSAKFYLHDLRPPAETEGQEEQP